MNSTQRHIDELYKTGATTFRDNLGAYPDYVVKFNDLVSSWVLCGGETLAKFFMEGNSTMIFITLKAHAESELKQLCIDYYGDE